MNNRESIRPTIIKQLEQITNFMRVFNFDLATDYIAINQFYDKLNDLMKPILEEESYIKKGRSNRNILCVETDVIYESAFDAADEYKIGKTTVRNSCLNKKTIPSVNLTFRFVDELEVD